MEKIGFDGVIAYPDDGFQRFVADLKASTDGADAAYEQLHAAMTAYQALLHFNANYLIIRDKARLADFVRDRLGGALAKTDALPGDEIEPAIDTVLVEIAKSINDNARRMDGHSPEYAYVYGMPVDQSDARLYDVFLAAAGDRAKAIAKEMTGYLRNTLTSRLDIEHARATQLLATVASIDGGAAPPVPADPVANLDDLLTTLAAATADARQNHAGLIEFSHFAEAALDKHPDMRGDDLIAAFAVTARNLPPLHSLQTFWEALIALSSWPRSANVITVTNNGGFAMRARAVAIVGKGETATDWTDSFLAGTSRVIDLRKGTPGARIQIEVDATAGKTDRSVVIFLSGLTAGETATADVTGATLTFGIDIR